MLTKHSWEAPPSPACTAMASLQIRHDANRTETSAVSAMCHHLTVADMPAQCRSGPAL